MKNIQFVILTLIAFAKPSFCQEPEIELLNGVFNAQLEFLTSETEKYADSSTYVKKLNLIYKSLKANQQQDIKENSLKYTFYKKYIINQIPLENILYVVERLNFGFQVAIIYKTDDLLIHKKVFMDKVNGKWQLISPVKEKPLDVFPYLESFESRLSFACDYFSFSPNSFISITRLNDDGYKSIILPLGCVNVKELKEVNSAFF